MALGINPMRSNLAVRLSIFLHLRHLLTLCTWSRDLHAQHDVPDLRLGEGSHVDVLLLPKILQDQVLELHLNLDPLLVLEEGVRQDLVKTNFLL